MAFIVVYDANVLYGNAVRDLFIRLARAKVVRAQWTDRILDEALGSLAAKRPDIAAEKIAQLRQMIVTAVPDCRIEGYEPLVENLKLPDPDDRHVLAAAIRAGAQIIVTSNLKDFPDEYIAGWNIAAKSPDDFLLDLIDLDDRVVWGCVQEIAYSRRNPPETAEDVLDELERAGLVEAVAALREGRRGA
ncbi:PIN domain-containing protein [Nocardia sp. NPDC058640]|uniref:PIN domain-containing protein n=1 Tax=Nocardia sp. NPDC058640 TaxID=3346571 RepID=UPI00364F62BA